MTPNGRNCHVNGDLRAIQKWDMPLLDEMTGPKETTTKVSTRKQHCTRNESPKDVAVIHPYRFQSAEELDGSSNDQSTQPHSHIRRDHVHRKDAAVVEWWL